MSSSSKRVLLIWDQCGQEPIELYEIYDDNLIKLAIQSQGEYINSSQDKNVSKLYNKMFQWENGKKKILPKGCKQIDVENYDQELYNAIVIAGFLP